MTTHTPRTPSQFMEAVGQATTPGQLTDYLSQFRRSQGMGRVFIDWAADDSVGAFDACRTAIYARAKERGFIQHPYTKVFE